MIDTRRDMDPVALLLSLFTTVVLLLTSPTRSLAAEESRDIAFHRIVSKDRGVTPSDSARYERRVVEDGAGKREFVIERKPAHVIPNAAIESVTIRNTIVTVPEANGHMTEMKTVQRSDRILKEEVRESCRSFLT